MQNQPASAPKNKTTQSVGESKKPSNPNGHSYIDIDFARKMIVHNQQGIQMADIAKKNAASAQVRQLATSISEELSNNTKQYIDWLTKWKETYFNLSDFPEMEGHDMYPTHPGMASLSDLSALESAAGNSVDTLFLRLMIAHHEGANEMATEGYFKEMQFGQMISLKDETLKQQTEEVQTMKQLQTK
ncbi:hypothetical protein B7Z28_00630 [Candidatus Saccharibacteria bacterium 32-45-3]|nr:MAG: hypothetical protein B7Z28_00630 [Candidatus Saccharibacteria bacterium 32-45-3]